MSHTEAHVDGSVQKNHLGPSQAKAGYGVHSTQGNLPDMQREVSGSQTVSRAEAEPVRGAVNQAHSAGYGSIDVHTDSNENLRGLEGRSTNNKDIWNQVDQVKSQGMIVKGFKVSSGENQAHDLAQQGAKK